jgi:hypothetical protein
MLQRDRATHMISIVRPAELARLILIFRIGTPAEKVRAHKKGWGRPLRLMGIRSHQRATDDPQIQQPRRGSRSSANCSRGSSGRMPTRWSAGSGRGAWRAPRRGQRSLEWLPTPASQPRRSTGANPVLLRGTAAGFLLRSAALGRTLAFRNDSRRFGNPFGTAGASRRSWAGRRCRRGRAVSTLAGGTHGGCVPPFGAVRASTRPAVQTGPDPPCGPTRRALVTISSGGLCP